MRSHRHRWRASSWRWIERLRVDECDRALELEDLSPAIGPALTVCGAVRVMDPRTGSSVIVESRSHRLRIRRRRSGPLPRRAGSPR